MNILLVGQCTLHWGRMEFGNIGNYYIVEPLVRELHRAFPGCSIMTTFQMSDDFCRRENVSVLPMNLYYGWEPEDLDTALVELASAHIYAKTGVLPKKTPYIEAVQNAGLVIDFSGDIWGDNADFLGEDRFFVGLCKNRVAQLLGKKTAMIAGSPGPFSNGKNLTFAREVFKHFNLVTNREGISREILQTYGFDNTKLHDLACPAFLFEPALDDQINERIGAENIISTDRPTVGFILCGWNFKDGPFDKWPRSDNEYGVFVDAVVHIEQVLGARVCLMSHSNGFPIPPHPFQLTHGRDYPIVKQLQRILVDKGCKHVFALDGVYDAWSTKAIIGRFDMLVSGRIHAAVAGLSQSVPTVIIDYGHQPKAHKMKGFASVAGVEGYVAEPNNYVDLKNKINLCWNNRIALKQMLEQNMPDVRKKAKENFSLLKHLADQL